MYRPALPLGLVVALLGCAPERGGAVVFRWRLVDALTGTIRPSCSVCVTVEPGKECDGLDVRVEEVRLHVVDQAGDEVPCSDRSCRPPCSALEWTTQFEVRPGEHRFSLEALVCRRPVGLTPPPVVREIQRGSITNLNAVEILLPAGTPPSPKQCPDGGA